MWTHHTWRVTTLIVPGILHLTGEMKASIGLLTVLCGLTTALIRDHVYVNISKNWTDAQTYCRKYYKDLSTIQSDGEQQILIGLRGENMSLSWFGLYREMKNFLWSDGDSFSFSKWQIGQPNNYNGNQDCVCTSYRWNDKECNNTYTFYCQNIFILIQEKMAWEEALEYCRLHHTDLATLTSERQLDLIKKETVESQTDSVWTGLRFMAIEWFWVNGKPLGNLVTLPACPVKLSRCGARNTKTDIWENRDCGEKLNFLCNWDVNTTKYNKINKIAQDTICVQQKFSKGHFMKLWCFSIK